MNKEYFFYILFAVLSTILNYLVQISVDFFFNIINIPIFLHYFYGSINAAFCIKIFSATLIAFVFKYCVDKIIIFKINNDSAINSNSTMILLYTVFAVFTTLIFWTTQLLFRLYIGYEYLGMIIGLAIGYTIKFLLDRKYVFVRENYGNENE